MMNLSLALRKLSDPSSLKLLLKKVLGFTANRQPQNESDGGCEGERGERGSGGVASPLLVGTVSALVINMK